MNVKRSLLIYSDNLLDYYETKVSYDKNSSKKWNKYDPYHMPLNWLC